jgi:ABC-2 type transport system ATP-binding protein
MSTGVLSVAELTKTYGSTLAVRGITFELAAGQTVALLGPNGAGKTTTLLCLAGLLRPDAGRITWAGEELGPTRSKAIAVVPDDASVFDMLTVWEHMIFVARGCRLRGDWPARASELLTRFEMADKSDVLGEALSRGMRQKLLIAASVLAGKPVLLLDEPMVGLDPSGQRELRTLLLDLRNEDTAIMVSTHLLESAESFCDRLLILKEGQIVAAGTMPEMLKQYGGTLESAFFEVTTTT